MGEWSYKTLTELGELNRGKSKHRPRDAGHLYGGDTPFIQTGDVKSSGGRINKYTQTYSEAGVSQSRVWPKETVAITIAANIAETGILMFPACFPDSVVGFISDPKKSNPYFMEYKFRELRKNIQQEHVGAGSVQDNINLAILRDIQFFVPDLPGQNAITSILKPFDDKIDLNRRMNETLEALAQAIFKDWFIDFGPVRRKLDGATDPVAILGGGVLDEEKAALIAAAFPNSLDERGLPEGWEDKGLDEVADFLNGLALQKYPPTGDNDLPVIKIAELRGGITAKTNRANRSIADKYLIKDGDFLFSWSGSLMAKFWTEGEGALNQHLFKVSSATHPRWFYSQWVHHHMPEFQTIAASKATTMGHIQRVHLKAARVVVPPEPALDAMTEIFQPLNDRIIHNDLENRTLAETRDYLLPKLMSGEVRVRDTETEIG